MKHVYVVLFDFDGQYEARNSEIVGVATSFERARELVRNDYAVNKPHRPGVFTDAWDSSGDPFFWWSSLDARYEYNITRTTLED